MNVAARLASSSGFVLAGIFFYYQEPVLGLVGFGCGIVAWLVALGT